MEGALRAAAKVERASATPTRSGVPAALCRVLELKAAADVKNASRTSPTPTRCGRTSGRAPAKQPKWEAAAEAWRGRAIGAAPLPGPEATNLGPFEQARLAATQDEERARKKMHPKRPDGSPNVEFYDDAGLYKAWLRDYASRSGSRKGSSVPMQQRSSGGGVSRGSKGRGLRFEARASVSMFRAARAAAVDVDMLVASLLQVNRAERGQIGFHSERHLCGGHRRQRGSPPAACSMRFSVAAR